MMTPPNNASLGEPAKITSAARIATIRLMGVNTLARTICFTLRVGALGMRFDKPFATRSLTSLTVSPVEGSVRVSVTRRRYPYAPRSARVACRRAHRRREVRLADNIPSQRRRGSNSGVDRGLARWRGWLQHGDRLRQGQADRQQSVRHPAGLRHAWKC